jgi:hypothetical protein
MASLRRIVLFAVVVAGVTVLRTWLLDADDTRTGYGQGSAFERP